MARDLAYFAGLLKSATIPADLGRFQKEAEAVRRPPKRSPTQV